MIILFFIRVLLPIVILVWAIFDILIPILTNKPLFSIFKSIFYKKKDCKCCHDDKCNGHDTTNKKNENETPITPNN